MELSVLIGKMAIFCAMMLIGYFIARSGAVDRSFGRSASWLALNVFLPATILNSVFISDRQVSAGELGRLMLILFAALGVGFVFAALIIRFLPIRHNPMRAPVFELLVGLSNTMFIGLPVAQSLFGSDAVFYCALSCIPFNLYAYIYGVWRMKSDKSSTPRVRDIFSAALIATLLAVFIFLLRIPVPGIVREFTAALNGATMPVSLLVIGFTMSSANLTDAFRNKELYLVSFLRNLVVPILTWLILRLFTSDPVLLMTCMLLAASPSAVMVTVFAIQYGRDGLFAAEGVLQSTLLSVVTIPVLILLLG
ncbi:MAG: AEC family transporter [Eubacteriales bacterium]|nr:AEC family transporter [Eubacteriales bacterium]